MKGFAAAALIVTVVLSLASCGGEGAPGNVASSVSTAAERVVMSYEGRELTSGMYAFIFSSMKTRYLQLLQSDGDTEFAEDTDTFWSRRTNDGKTFAKAVTDDINTYCRMLLVCEKMASEYKVELSSDAVEEAVAKYDGYVVAYGGEDGLGRYLNRCGINAKQLSAYLRSDRLIPEVQEKLCSDGGPCAVSDVEVRARTNADYAKAKHVFLSDKKHGGNALDKAEKMLGQIKCGEKTFSDFKGFSEDDSAAATEGLIIAEGVSDKLYADTVFALKAGECAVCKAENGAYLLMRTELTGSECQGLFESVRSRIADEKFSKLLSERYDFVELDREELEKYDIVTADLLL